MTNGNARIITFITMLSLSSLLNGCGEETAPVQQGGTQSGGQKPATAKKIEVPADEVKKIVEYIYDPSGKRDPFHPAIEDATIIQVPVADVTGSPGLPPEPPTEPEMYDLTQFRLVAVMKFGKKSVAMIQDPDGKGHTLYMGTLVGRNKGKVVSIEEGRVLVEEKYRTVTGDIKSVTQEIVMQTGEEKR